MKYRSGVRALLYLVKHSQPDIANAIWEHSKMMDKAMEQHYESLLWVIKYVLDTKDKVLGLCPKEMGRDLKWWLLPYGDSNWAGDEDQRLSITGWVIYLMGAPIS